MVKGNLQEVNKLSTNNLRTIAAFCVYESGLRKDEKLALIAYIEHVANRKNLLDMIIIREADLMVTSVIIAAALASGNKAYYKIFSASTQACREEQDRNNCIKQYKLNGLAAKRNEIRKHISKCNQTINPSKCRESFSRVLEKIEKEISKTRLM